MCLKALHKDALSASALIILWLISSNTFAQRAYSLIYSQNLKGGHVMFGNTSMAIYSSGNGKNGGTIDVGKMNDFSNYSNGKTSSYGNDDNNMQFVNIDYSAANPPTSTDLISFKLPSTSGTPWKYLSSTTDFPTNNNWIQPGFAETGWSTGNAPLGFGSSALSPLSTTIAGQGTNSYYANGVNTVYLRYTFSVSNPSTYKSLSISLRYAHGAVVYLNGVEVGRVNVNAGTIVYTTPALSDVGSSYNELTWDNLNNILIAGNNTIAVEVHRMDGSNRDGLLYFDLNLKGNSTVNNASSADLKLPTTGTNTIKFARLYWGGRISTSAIYNGATNLRSVKIRKGTSGNYLTLMAASTQFDSIMLATGAVVYQSYVDITNYINTNGAGTYTVADIAASVGSSSGGGNFAGWSMVVAYENSVQTNYYSTRIYDGFLQVINGNSTSVTLTGFDGPSSGLQSQDAYLSTFSWDGDANLGSDNSNSNGDFLQINGTKYTDALNPKVNVWNGTISDTGQHVTSKNPNFKNQMGIDIDRFQVGTGFGIQPNASQVSILFGTESDKYFPSVFSFSLKMKPPSLSIGKYARGNLQSTPNDTAKWVHPSEEFTYTIYGQNASSGSSYYTKVTDTIPSGITYIPGSLKILASGTSGWTGSATDAADNDNAFIATAPNGKVYATFYVGNGATNTQGGELEIGEQYIVQLKVTAPTIISALSEISNTGYVIAKSQANENILNQATFIIPFSGNPLAVRLISFDAIPQNGTSYLSWATSSEKNSAYYNIQSSTDGRTFTNIGSVKAMGTTTTKTVYSLIHEAPANGTNYYRLQEVDLDGKIQYSNILSVHFGSKKDNSLIVTPNPTTGNAKIILKQELGKDNRIILYNNLGIEVYKINNSIGREIDLNLSGLPVGLYQIVVSDQNDIIYQDKILKQ